MCQYPKELLPQSGFRISMPIDEMAGSIPLTVVRRSNVKIDYPAISSLPENCITSDEVPGMSMSLLGGGFKGEKHICYRQKNTGAKEWDGVTLLNDEEICDGYDFIPDAFPIYFSLKEIHKVRIPYKRQFDKQDDFNNFFVVKSAVNAWEKGRGYRVEGEITVAHKPTMMNYWHVELQISAVAGKDMHIKKGKAAWNRSLRYGVVDHLHNNFLFPADVKEYTIPESMYKNKA